MKIPFSIPYVGEEEKLEVLDAINSNWLSKGPKTIQFEKMFSKYVDSPFSIGLNSCTAGLHLACLALGIGEGDEVIVTPYTFVSTVNTIIHCGAIPVFVDIDFQTMNIDVPLIEKAITNKTKAVIPVHFAGYPCEMDLLLDIADRHGLKIIEDAAHAVYTQYKGKMIGSLGDITCFSFYATKNLATGEGGMLTTQNEEIADRIRVMSLHGMSRNAWNRYGDQGSWFYEVHEAGFKYNMTDIQAAFGIAQLKKLEHMQTLRKKCADLYNKAFTECEELILPHDSLEHRHAWHLYVIRLREEMLTIDRNEFIQKLTEVGIGTSVHFIPVPQHPYYQKLGYDLSDYPQTQKAFESTISLPFYPGLSESQIHYVTDHVIDIISKYKI
ncbi:DegT/DnrJ/EryC1/StrS family aminotransferase [Chengkuizengella sediminis]|uniref:DegT/DnrJ/EryC1/StrS family aminotransferase n=1 Tax=Chengkuizengella sediminis TaxID=1885917 RepID=UPI001389894B|nr:DegT/DnrJ/EryC1/StrS aminotransferase family protein [Chengkuizengella sediminis]NDI34871.1 DegT/DnrJ/EryC1/StrS aminotransferase family protein [Chengkuizengella sediminis]